MAPIVVQGMFGLGDNIYQRSILRELAKQGVLYLETPWPQLFRDLPIRCVRPVTKLRTQAKNVGVAPAALWHRPPPGMPRKRVHYVGSNGTILQGLCDSVGLQPRSIIFDAPDFGKATRPCPYIVIRPATIRTEWHAESRNPLPEYLAFAADKLREHFHIVSVADFAQGAEWPVLPLPYADETYHAGELSVEQLFALVGGAAGLVGGVGWIVPAAIAYRVPLFLTFGGWGRHNGPARIFDPRLDVSRIYQAIPDRFCMCGSNSHACDKRISGFDRQFERWLVGLLAARASAVDSGTRSGLVSGDGESVQRSVLGAIPAV